MLKSRIEFRNDHAKRGDREWEPVERSGDVLEFRAGQGKESGSIFSKLTEMTPPSSVTTSLSSWRLARDGGIKAAWLAAVLMFVMMLWIKGVALSDVRVPAFCNEAAKC